jgi:hypothetical protein
LQFEVRQELLDAFNLTEWIKIHKAHPTNEIVTIQGYRGKIANGPMNGSDVPQIARINLSNPMCGIEFCAYALSRCRIKRSCVGTTNPARTLAGIALYIFRLCNLENVFLLE